MACWMQRQNGITKHQKSGDNQWGIYFLLLLHDMLISVKVMFIKKKKNDLDEDKILQQNFGIKRLMSLADF